MLRIMIGYRASTRRPLSFIITTCLTVPGSAIVYARDADPPVFGVVGAAGPMGTADSPEPPIGALSVEEAVQEALGNNLELIAARYDVPIARAEKITAKRRLNPVLSFGADHLDLLGTGYNNINKAGPQEFFVRADVFIMGGRKRKHRIEHAELVQGVAELRFADAVRRLRLRVQLACVDVQLAEENLALAQANQALFADLVQLNQKRAESGEIAGVELRRARIAASEADNEVRRREADLVMTRNVLGELLGRDDQASVSIADDFRRTGTPPSRTELHARALEHRPDYQATQREDLRASRDIKRQIAEGKIDVSIGVEVRRQQGLAGTGNSLGVFFSVPLPIFDRNQGQIERAQQVELAAEANLEAVGRAIQTEVDNGFVTYRTALDLLETYEGGLLDDAESVLHTAAYAYRRGEVSLMQLLDAQWAFNSTRDAYNRARAAYAQSLYTIEAVSANPLAP